MKKVTVIFFAALLTGYSAWGVTTANETPLFQIIENGRTGFIDSTGRVVIKPMFLDAQEFSEGLAAARLNGTYGYIDSTGKFVIEPQFDYATPFSEELAVVFKDGRPFFISKTGQKPFECNFKALNQFKNGRALILTASKKIGVIDKQGKLVIDTAFISIEDFVEGLAVVVGVSDSLTAERRRGWRNTNIGVIDTLGHFVVPYGKYDFIGSLSEGLFKVTTPAQPWDTIDGYTQATGFIDKTGKLIFSKDEKDGSSINGDIHCGLAKMNLYKYWLPEAKAGVYSSSTIYEGYINLKGEIAINDTNFRFVEDFNNGRAFVRDSDYKYSVINTEGRIVSKEKYGLALERGFKNGLAFVSAKGGWGLIDTNANFIVKPRFYGIDEVGLVNGYFFYSVENRDEKNKHEELYGIARQDGHIVYKAVMEDFDLDGFVNGLLKCVINDKLAYINKDGKIVYQQLKDNSAGHINMNIDFMNRGYFTAYSKPHKTDIGGFGKSDNSPQKISETDNFPPNSLSIIVQPENMGIIWGRYNAITVLVVNTAKKGFEFNAENSRLNMKVQALNTKGEWKDIEYLPNSWCGNSYHVLTLEPGNYWSFMTPVYEGDFKTKLRIALEYIDPTDKSESRYDRKSITLYSNQFDGSINPAQFWRKREYYPQGIMDSYNE